MDANLEQEVIKDATVFMSRVGCFEADVKVKWVDFHSEQRSTADGMDQYRVSGDDDVVRSLNIFISFSFTHC